MTQLELPLCLAANNKQADRLVTVFVNMAGHSVTRQVPASVYLKGWSLTSGWLKAGDAL